jgi:hypothetical protein
MGNWFLLKNNLMPVDDSIFDYNRNVLFVKEVELRAILFKYTWERGECHLFQTPPPIEKKNPHTTTRIYF